MRLARKLALLTVATLAALAMSATAASADPVEGIGENDVHCNPCNIHITGETRTFLTANPAVVISRCEEELAAEIYEDGSGHITSLTNQNHSGGNCTLQQCNGIGEPASEVEWEFQVTEVAPNTVRLTTTFCLDSKSNPNAQGSHCTGNITITEPVLHNYVLSMSQACPNGVTVAGDWSLEGTPIEFAHT